MLLSEEPVFMGIETSHPTPPPLDSVCPWLLIAPSGSVDASLTLQHSMAQPVLGGWVRLSKGVAFLLPQGSAPQATSAAAAKDLQVRAVVFGSYASQLCHNCVMIDHTCVTAVSQQL